MEVHNTSDSTVEFLHGQEMAYFDARSKGLVQINNSKHFPIDQYLHDRMTPATLCPSPLAYKKPIHPTKMPCITTQTELPIDDTNKSTPDDKYPWLDPDDPRRNMTDKEILQMKLNLKDSILNDIKKLLINPPVLKAPTPDGLFQLESNTSREGTGGTLLQKQGDEWVFIGYHSKKLPKSAKNFGVTEN